jgi:hypothetical protein
MACGWEREWVVSGGVCFWVASARAGGGRRSWGRSVLAPPRSMGRVAGLVTRWRTSLLKAPSPFGAPTPEGPSKPGAASHAVVPWQSTLPSRSLTLGSPHGPGASPSQ